MDYLSETGEVNLLGEVRKELDTLVKSSEVIDDIRVTSALPLQEKEKEKIKKMIFMRFQFDLPVVNKIDQKLIGGLIVEVGDWVFDASIAHQLANIKKSLLE